MQRRNVYTLGFIVSVITVIILNCTIVYLNCQSKEYFSSANKILSKTVADNSQKILASYDYSEYENAHDDLLSQYNSINEYYEAIRQLDGQKSEHYFRKQEAEEISLKYNYSESQASEQLDQIQYCIDRLDYALEYPQYISGICSDASDMSSADIFNEAMRKNIIKTGSDFYGLENIRISAESEFGIKLLFSDSVSDMLAVFAAIICALFYSLRCHAGFSDYTVKSRGILFSILFSTGIAVLYLCNIHLTNMFSDIGHFNRAVQSVNEFESCPYVISVGILVFIRIIFKVTASLTVFLLCSGIFSGLKRIRYVLYSVLIIVSEVIMLFAGVKITFLSEFRAENIIAKYGNIIFAGEAINSIVILVVSTCVLFCLAAAIAYKNISAAVKLAVEQAEKAYCDELDHRYTEVRLIRHDIKNHLCAVAALLDEGDTDGARRYLGEVSEELENVRPPVKTGSAVLDALMMKKYTSAASGGITVSTEFTVDFSEYGFTDYDLCSVFSNILDNAFEACEKLSDEDKKISLVVKNQMDMICIFCENKYKEISRSGGIFSTTKSDKFFHGLGLKTIIRIASKYGGDVKVIAENNIFSISVLLMKQ